MRPSTRLLWAKSSYSDEGRKWLPLYLHLLDSAAIARYIVDIWVVPANRTVITCEFENLSEEEALDEFIQISSWLAGLHDCGKATPAFSIKDKYLDDRVVEAGLNRRAEETIVSRNLHHSIAGQVVFERWASERGSSGGNKSLASVIGAHHGVPASVKELNEAPRRRSELGDDTWKRAQFELMDAVTKHLDAEAKVLNWLERQWSEPFLMLLASIVIISDWLASSSEFFPYIQVDDGGEELMFDSMKHTDRVGRAIRLLDIPSPWQAHDLNHSADYYLKTRFDLPDGALAKPAQVLTAEIARTMDLPGLMILEESTGSGKTEAALIAAEILAARTGRAGVLFALPTQATTDAMFDRQMEWLTRIESSYRDCGAPSTYTAQLIHSRSRFHKGAAELRRRGDEIRDRSLSSLSDRNDIGFEIRPTGINIDGGEPAQKWSHAGGSTANDIAILSWFRGKKKALLSDFVVSTVDHVLFSAMKAPHLMLRHLGLARKVVIIDEVHSYSSYMNTFLEKALTWLAAYSVPVILLSATLSEQRASALSDAYLRGLKIMNAQKVPFKPAPAAIQTPFPCLISTTISGTEVVPIESSGKSSKVSIRKAPPEDELACYLDGALRDSGCVLIIRNTVKRAQDTFKLLKEYFGDIVSLHHARFTIFDRAAKDKDLLARFGSPRKVGIEGRPERAIVVATQVAEQSLDIDFDLLITDLAPIDLILQRMGRLHRHERKRPEAFKEPVCMIDRLPDRDSSDPELESGSNAIYGTKDMLLSAECLHEVIEGAGAISTPDDVHTLMERVYARDADVSNTWQEVFRKACDDHQKKVEKLSVASETFLMNDPKAPSPRTALTSQMDVRVSDSEEGRARVRDGEDSLEVLLVEEVRVGSQVEFRTMPGAPMASNEIIPTDREPEWRIARAMALSSVRLPPSLTKDSIIYKTIASLEKNYFEAWQLSYDLKGQLILPLIDGRAVINGETFMYDAEVGLQEVSEE